ncbi:MAG: LPS-assembly protein LptD [Devosia sp.]|uniref:LPS-assembly protein LptD n=1 Tax=Devosia sp. TaxID=1871048 RepID=UPI0026339201|nr:LPS assembly protein LptD [Devosia sp.]MDB5531276.1 LPS-assembly protein LptD [Devosia sp.]
MSKRGWGSIKSSLRLAAASAVALCMLGSVAMAQLVPADFFNAPIDPSAPTSVEADDLQVDAPTSIITATGDVVLGYGGYIIKGQKLVYNRTTRDAHFIGAVTITDPSGNVLETEDFEVKDGMKRAFITAMTITTYDGARITADSTDYDKALQTLLDNATYSPCGDCIDDEGRRVGWSMKAKRITYSSADGSLAMDQPSLALLGIPVAWLPYLWLPDTSQTALANVRMPTYDYSDAIGHKVAVPISAYSSKYTDVILTPTLLTRQGLLMDAEWVQRFEAGSFRIKGSGVYQLDPTAFTFAPSQREWRGAIQTSGNFVPAKDWKVGWSYTAFSDFAYFEDYRISTAETSVNEVYATHLTDDTYFDARLQQFNVLGQVTRESQDLQGNALPKVRFEQMLELAPGMGRVEITGRLLGVRRESDYSTSANGVPYQFGYAGNKNHAVFQAGWQNQYIGGGGFVATPYLGGRLDIANYDSASAIGPADATLWSATPIAAMDVRFPLAASDGSTVHLVEPIVQVVYRGTDNGLPGITNDDSQSFIFDDTNLFSYNRFSGMDRQETGLRANVGGRYQANFANGSYVELVAGQSFQLAGPNAYAVTDPTLVGVGSGLDVSPSYAVLGAYGSFVEGVTVGGKVQADTGEGRVTRAEAGADYTNSGYSAGVKYAYIAANPALGVLIDQQQIGAYAGVPLADYWTLTGNAYWDITSNQFLQVGAGLTYDDGYLVIGGTATRTGPTHTSPDDTRFTASFFLKAPAGLNLGYSGAVAVPGFSP